MIILSLVLLIFFAYRGYSIIFIAPLFAVVAAIGSGHDPMPVFSEIYMTKAAEYVKTYYPVFLLGAIFAKIMEEGGLAASVANKIVQKSNLSNFNRLRRADLRRTKRLCCGVRHVSFRGDFIQGSELR